MEFESALNFTAGIVSTAVYFAIIPVVGVLIAS